MNPPFRMLLVAAAVAGCTGVVFGAFGAHGLEEFLLSQGMSADLIPKRLSQFETGSRYHLVHAVVLLALSALAGGASAGGASAGGASAGGASAGSGASAGGKVVIHRQRLRLAGILFMAGIVLFSGSLYLLVVSNTTWLGAITPIGGVCWIIAWAMLAFCGGSPAE